MDTNTLLLCLAIVAVVAYVAMNKKKPVAYVDLPTEEVVNKMYRVQVKIYRVSVVGVVLLGLYVLFRIYIVYNGV